MTEAVDVLIIGAGAAGLMCAATAAKRGRKVLLVDHANKIGKKILMSGGGKCNFTNQVIEPENFISHNPHFCKSALARYTQWDFIALVEKHQIPYHEKTLGQLFCDKKSSDILNMLVSECQQSKVVMKTHFSIKKITFNAEKNNYFIMTSEGELIAESVVIATGGLSIPTMGATGFGFEVAKQFALKAYPSVAGLVPFLFNPRQQTRFKELAGTAVEVRVSSNGQSFREAMLFTHKGLSGPAILQISSYWQPGTPVEIDLLPDRDAKKWLLERQQQRPQAELKTILAEILTKKLSETLSEYLLKSEFESLPIKQLSEQQLETIAQSLTHWIIYPEATEGYRTAEVTMGGVDTDEISSKTFGAKKQPGLYFIGEVLDVSGHLGGFNFQWAWSSGFAAGNYA